MPLELSDVYPVPQITGYAMASVEVAGSDVVVVTSEEARKKAERVTTSGRKRLFVIPSYKVIYSYADELIRSISCVE